MDRVADHGENKATIGGAGDRTSGPVLRSGCPQLVLQEAWAWLTAAQLVRAGEAASLRSQAAAARALRRNNAKPVTADEESFTAARHHAIRSMETTQVTAVSSLRAIAAAADAAARAHLHTLNIPGRERHSPRVQKARPKFGAHIRDQENSNRETPGHRVCARPLLNPGTPNCARKEEPVPPARGPRPVEPRARPAATRGPKPCPHTRKKRTQGNTRNTRTLTTRQG